jgi:hypothetical protein
MLIEVYTFRAQDFVSIKMKILKTWFFNTENSTALFGMGRSDTTHTKKRLSKKKLYSL